MKGLWELKVFTSSLSQPLNSPLLPHPNHGSVFSSAFLYGEAKRSKLDKEEVSKKLLEFKFTHFDYRFYPIWIGPLYCSID